jgi:hypothetical protein
LVVSLFPLLGPSLIEILVTSHGASLSSEEQDEKWIREWTKERKSRDRILQRGLYLLKELEELDTRKDTLGDEKALCKRKDALLDDLGKLARNIWENKQTYARIVREIHLLGPWAAAYFFMEALYPEELSQEAKFDCLLRGGCYTRLCGCCRKFRGRKYKKGIDVLGCGTV